MTPEHLEKDWQNYAIDIGGKIVPLKERFLLCAQMKAAAPGFEGVLLFDTGGEQGSPAYFFKIGENGEDLISVNPENSQETEFIGKLVPLP